jgi:hypothetical protein
MSDYLKIVVREGFYFSVCMVVGLLCAPVIFYSDATLTSIWNDTTFTVSAFDKYWDDLVRYREFRKVWWKICSPYVAFQIIRVTIWKVRTSIRKRHADSRISD